MGKKSKTTYAMSRRRRNLFVCAFILFGVGLIWLDHAAVRQRAVGPGASYEKKTSADFGRYNGKEFVVVKVVDGDTIDLGVADGGYDSTRIRLLGIDTPETKQPGTAVMYFGPEAAEAVEGLCLGNRVRVFIDDVSDVRDKYGRLLGYVQLGDGRFLNEVLVSEGFAYADLRFEHSFYYKYSSLEAAARSGRKGLWEGVTREELPWWLREKKPRLLGGK